MYTTTCLFHWPRNILLTQWTRIQREAYSISVRKHLCLVLILGNVGQVLPTLMQLLTFGKDNFSIAWARTLAEMSSRCDSCLLLIKKVAGRVWILDAARKRILIVAFDLTYWVLDFAPYIYCRATPEQVKYLWDVTPSLWCNQCYLDNFVVHSAKGVFCHNVPYMPRVAIALSLDIEAKVKVIWNSLAAGQCLDLVIENYAKGTYCPVYTKIWEYPDGTQISTSHLSDRTFSAFGPWLQALRTPSSSPSLKKSTADAATQTACVSWYWDDTNRRPGPVTNIASCRIFWLRKWGRRLP